MVNKNALPGFRDFFPEDCRWRNHLFRVWRKVSSQFAFEEYDAPVLEDLALFTAKSGPEIVSQLFSFTDKGGREVALRPEMTPSLVRMAGQRAGSLPRPVRWFSIGEQYRYERKQKGRLRAFYQYNADILGESSVAADGELILLLDQLLQQAGLRPGSYQILLSDRRLWWSWLSGLGFDEVQCTEILGVVDKWGRLPEEKRREQLLACCGGKAALLEASIEGFLGLEGLGGIRDFLTSSLGSLNEGLENSLAELESLAGLLDNGAPDLNWRFDAGIVRGLAYYTGIVFEAFDIGRQSRAIAGGGRYDDLFEKLTGKAMPAAGFGMGDVVVSDLLEEQGGRPAVMQKPDAYLIPGGQQVLPDMYRLAADFRAMGYSVLYPLKPTAFGKALKTAGNSGATLALMMLEEEWKKGSLVLKDLQEGRQMTLAASAVLPAVQSILREGEWPVD